MPKRCVMGGLALGELWPIISPSKTPVSAGKEL